MTGYPTWTPAARPGIIPLHPLGFGTILGRSFAALRHNPRVLFGFAVVVQTVGTLVAAAGVAAVGIFSFSRLATLSPGTDDFEAVLAGSIALTAVTGVVLTLAAAALSVLVQGIVVGEVAHAAVAEKQTLGMLWRRVKPVAGRLIAYTALVSLTVLVVLAIITAGLVALTVTVLPIGIVAIVLTVVAAIPLSLWLFTKLLLVPSAIVLEHATVMGAIRRSWVLIRGRFWVALGISVIISVCFGALAQVANVPFSFLSAGLGTIINPTGSPDVAAVIGVVVTALLTQLIILVIQAVSLIVQSTSAALIYIDCRMRREGLDLDLLAYVDRRDGGETDLPDPYRLHVGREIVQRAPVVTGYPVAYPAAGYPAGPAPVGSYPVAPPLPTPLPAPPASPNDQPTRWTAPGGS